MSADFMPHLYEPFSQESRPEAGGVGGTGSGAVHRKAHCGPHGRRHRREKRATERARASPSACRCPAAADEAQTSAKPRSTVSGGEKDCCCARTTPQHGNRFHPAGQGADRRGLRRKRPGGACRNSQARPRGLLRRRADGYSHAGDGRATRRPGESAGDAAPRRRRPCPSSP
jgi:hypothetical protein